MLISHPRVLLDPQFGVPQTPPAYHEVGGEVCWWGRIGRHPPIPGFWKFPGGYKVWFDRHGLVSLYCITVTTFSFQPPDNMKESLGGVLINRSLTPLQTLPISLFHRGHISSLGRPVSN